MQAARPREVVQVSKIRLRVQPKSKSSSIDTRFERICYHTRSTKPKQMPKRNVAQLQQCVSAGPPGIGRPSPRTQQTRPRSCLPSCLRQTKKLQCILYHVAPMSLAGWPALLAASSFFDASQAMLQGESLTISSNLSHTSTCIKDTSQTILQCIQNHFSPAPLAGCSPCMLPIKQHLCCFLDLLLIQSADQIQDE